VRQRREFARVLGLVLRGLEGTLDERIVIAC